MLFWILAAALALACALILTRAFRTGRGMVAPEGAYDIQVYRDQLAEVERDISRGTLAVEDGARARTEVSRKILEADRAMASSGAQADDPVRGTAIIGTLMALAVVAGGLGIYAEIGADGARDLPLAKRVAEAEAARGARIAQSEAEALATEARGPAPVPDPQYADLMDQLRKAVAARPDDLQGLGLLVRNEASLGNFAAAVAAQRQVLAVKGDAAPGEDLAALGELLVLAAGGYVSPEAEAAFNAGLLRDPKNGTARFYKGLAEAQTGRPDLAFPIWKSLLEQSPPQAPWVPVIAAQIGDLAWAAGVNYTPPTTGGPSAADVAAAEAMPDADRQAMIRTMVEGLNDRLATEGGPAEDWAKLVMALGVLGEAERARAILTEAEGVFATDADGLKLLQAAATRAGITE